MDRRPARKINDLYVRLLKNPKHHNLTLLEYGYVHRRDFADWSMAAVATAHIPLNLLDRYAVLEKYDPFQMSGDAARTFLLEVAETQRGHVCLD
ncbi:MAG: BLUF domain-containing protein [Desulfovibrio sp.]